MTPTINHAAAVLFSVALPQHDNRVMEQSVIAVVDARGCTDGMQFNLDGLTKNQAELVFWGEFRRFPHFCADAEKFAAQFHGHFPPAEPLGRTTSWVKVPLK